MAKNFRPGPNWLPATVVERLGPLSYLVETTDEQLWRRHVDHLKRRTDSQPEWEGNSSTVNPPVVHPEPPTSHDTPQGEAEVGQDEDRDVEGHVEPENSELDVTPSPGSATPARTTPSPARTTTTTLNQVLSHMYS